MLEWRVPGYRTVRELGQSASGRSVLAVHEASGLPVALRYHAPAADPVTAQSRLAALRADARALAGVHSPHVAPLYEHVEVVLAGQPGAATVREYVDGASLRSVLRAAKLPPESALSVLRAGLLALAAGQARGLAHRGYKPANLLVDAAGTTRLADFSANPTGAAGLTGESSAGESPDVTTAYAQDVRAAFGVLVACVRGDRKGAAAQLPRRLRPLAAPAAAGDGPALLEAVEVAGRDGWGADWRAKADRELARLVARARPRRER